MSTSVRNNLLSLCGSLLLIFMFIDSSSGQQIEPRSEPDGSANNDLTDLSDPQTADEILDLDQLGNVDVVVPSFDVEVTFVTRSESTVSKSPAAVFVITQEMIRRSTATSVPDLLRMVPGLQVARIDANKWAISARGFNGRFANKLLVMIDGRSIYTPIFSGAHQKKNFPRFSVQILGIFPIPGICFWLTALHNFRHKLVRNFFPRRHGYFFCHEKHEKSQKINSANTLAVFSLFLP
jgi:hypothetical protein